MAITLLTAARNAACDAVVDLVDAGGGAGYVKIYTAAFAAVLVKVNLAATAFGSASTGTATAAGLPKSGTASATGTANVYKVFDFADTEIWRGTCPSDGTGSMTLDGYDITSGQVVTITSWTHTQPA